MNKINCPPQTAHSGRWASPTQDVRSWASAKSSLNANFTPIWVNGKVVGQVQGDVFYKTVVIGEQFASFHDLNAETIRKCLLTH